VSAAETLLNHQLDDKARFDRAQSAALVIIVFGDPAPQGSKAFKGLFTGKDGRQHAKLAESSKRVKPWRQDVVAAARQAVAGAAPLDGALVVRMVFTVPKPASAPKRRTSWPNKRPDCSKLCRSTEDALVTAGAIADDARIVGYERLFKVYPNEDPDALTSPGVRIEIRRLDEVQTVRQGQLAVA
jgi:Holliday junction resolvase RusA-like endonuclease